MICLMRCKFPATSVGTHVASTENTIGLTPMLQEVLGIEGGVMNLVKGRATILRIFIAEDDRHHGNHLFEAILVQAREMRLAGCTVFRGVEGFGASAAIHSSRVLRLTEDHPMVVEVVDTRSRLNPFIKKVETMVAEAGCGTLMTVEEVEIIQCHEKGN